MVPTTRWPTQPLPPLTTHINVGSKSRCMNLCLMMHPWACLQGRQGWWGKGVVSGGPREWDPTRVGGRS